MRIIWLVFMLLVAPVLAQDERQNDSPTNTQDQSSSSNQEVTPGRTSLSESGPAINPASNSSNQENVNQRTSEDSGSQIANSIAALDLTEQRRMAFATEDMAFYALIALVFTFIGLILLGLTLHYTRKAADSTKKTLEIAQNTIKQNRAYMLIDHKSIGCIKAGENTFRFIAEWVNFGESPAMDVVVQCVGALIKDGHDLSKPLEYPSLGSFGMGMSLGKGQKAYGGGFPETEGEKMLETNQVAHFQSDCIYTDVHQRTFKATFSAVIQVCRNRTAPKGETFDVKIITTANSKTTEKEITQTTDNQSERRVFVG